MLLAFLYHCTNKEKYSNSIDMIEEQFIFFKKKYKTILPGEKIALFKINIMISFDDAYFDFYHYVFPLLKKYKIKAISSVPVKFIIESTSLDSKTRLLVPYADAMKKNNYKTKVPFCTWKEIKEMSETGLVKIANQILFGTYLSH